MNEIWIDEAVQSPKDGLCQFVNGFSESPDIKKTRRFYFLPRIMYGPGTLRVSF